jgi:hypothetical protein
MIYENGKLNNKMTEWKTSAKEIDLEKNIKGNKPGLWETISYHQGEIHINEEKYRSVQKMSNDLLYTLKTNSHFSGIKTPKSAAERRLKNALDQETNQYLQNALNQLINYYQINRDNFHIISLQSLTGYNEKALPGFDQQKSQEIIGKLWEGLYKNYFINITTKSGQKVSPIGSSMPYILLSKDKTHLFVLFQTSTGENIQLIQYIS